jgi:shikimate 5-dehydrogenase
VDIGRQTPSTGVENNDKKGKNQYDQPAKRSNRGHNGVCVAMQVPEGDLEVALAGLAPTPNVDGILVTMPHKFAAFGHCATSSERARMLGVVSVIRRNADGTWHGDMLDGLAFVQAQLDQGAQVEGARALLVGAGGAGSAIAIALLEAGVGELVIHDADAARVAVLLELLADHGDGRVTAGLPDTTGSCHYLWRFLPQLRDPETGNMGHHAGFRRGQDEPGRQGIHNVLVTG